MTNYSIEIKVKKYKQKKARNKPVVVNFILDQSGSMMSLRDKTISSFNEYIQSLKKENKGKMLFSLSTFSSDTFGRLRLKRVFSFKPIEQVRNMTFSDYMTDGGTPLYDAVCKTLKEAEEMLENRYEDYASIVVIMTDGEENMSQEYDAAYFRDYKRELENKGNWSFVYMGANQNAWANAQKWGFDKGNVLTWTFSEQGMDDVVGTLTRSTNNYVAMACSSMNSGRSVDNKNFFDKSRSK